ncbi:MAG: glycosyltransferase family 4 protein, partial [Rickettsiales bacterium]
MIHLQKYNSAIPDDKQPVILQVLPELRAGGVERGTIEMAAAIQAAGWKAIVVSAGGEMAKQLAHSGATHIELPLQTKNPFKIRANAKALERIIREHQVDIVHARSRAPAWSAYWAAKVAHVRFVTTFHGTYGIQNSWKKRYNSIMTRGSRVIAISEFIADHIHQNYEMDASRLRLIHRGVDVEKFDPAKVSSHRLRELSEIWRLPDDLPVILLPGRITRWKGQHVLLEALAKLPHRNFYAVLLGDDQRHPGYRKELEEMTLKLGLSGHACMAPNTPYMPEAYTLAHVVVAPSTDPEAFGRIPIEAQAMGKPVVA